MMARVQAQAESELPGRVVAEVKPDCAGLTRAIRAMAPTGHPDALVHSLDVDLPLRHRGPTVATVHDLSVFDTPWAFSPVRARGEQALLSLHLRRADELVAVSRFTADRIGERFDRKATVAHLAPRSPGPPTTADRADPAGAVGRVRELYDLPMRFVLHVGTVEPRKDVPGLAAACRRVGVELVLAGAIQDPLPDMTGVRALGYVSQDDLAPLFEAATVVAYPSKYEGFGLPPVEALAGGAAVVATAVGALPEVLGTFGYPLARPGDGDGLVQLLGDAVNDETFRSELRSTGRAAVDRLSWAENARTTLGVYESLGVAGDE